MPFSWARARSTDTTSAIRWCGEQAVVLDLQLPGLDLRQVENVVDQLEQVLAAGADRADVVAALGLVAVVGVADEQLGEAEDAVERRANLVAHVGQELALGAVGGLGLLLGQPEVFFVAACGR